MSKKKHTYLLNRSTLIFGLFLFSLGVNAEAEISIKGQLKIDSSWAPKVYLSVILTFDQLNSMSNQMIIESAEINESGKYSFKSDYLPSEDYVYRLHVSKKDDPAASLIIGGNDENHIFLIANSKSAISIISNDTVTLFGNATIENSVQSKLLQKINQMALYVDTASFVGSTLKRDLMKKALDEELRQYADTCSFPLVALYALYKSNFESDIEENNTWYSRFLEKWENIDSPYFEEFRKKIPSKRNTLNYSLLFGITGLFVGAGLSASYFKLKTNDKLNPIQELTIQERKIFSLLQLGKSNKEISEELSISLSTVKSHVNSIFSKLGIKSRKEVLIFKINN